jgi:hypothetical protein
MLNVEETGILDPLFVFRPIHVRYRTNSIRNVCEAREFMGGKVDDWLFMGLLKMCFAFVYILKAVHMILFGAIAIFKLSNSILISILTILSQV